ncbi:MAG TPA: hypothetical protein VFR41_02400 [Acidimicrobiia bacterium]|nr:hypothetical protein [Acidimicrobiia bacterium]
MVVALGTLALGAVAHVHDNGTIEHASTTVRTGIIGSDARPRVVRPGAAPIARVSWRVPGGEVVQHVFAVDTGVVIDTENASPEAIAIGLQEVTDTGTTLHTVRPPGDRRADGTVVFPLPHRQTLRAVLSKRDVDPRSVADAQRVLQGWERVLERGMRTELSEPLQTQIDAARVDALLAPPSGDAFATLEAWGFDAEAISMWSHLGFRGRRAARRATGTGLLADVRAELFREGRGEIDVLPGFRPAWLGQHLAVHGIPLRDGRGGFALRWHGARPALLWELPEGLTIRVPALDPGFSSSAAQGEELLAAASPVLLSMGASARADGVAIDEPESFS